MKAFPTTKPLEGWGDPNQGMDLRDYFAAKATEQDIEYYMWTEWQGNGYISTKRQILTREKAKYAYADAMMKAREQGK